MTGLTWLAVWCGSGALAGTLVGGYKGRPCVGLVLGTCCGVFGWLLLSGAEPRHRPSPRAEPTRTDAADDVPSFALSTSAPVDPPVEWLSWRAAG